MAQHYFLRGLKSPIKEYGRNHSFYRISEKRFFAPKNDYSEKQIAASHAEGLRAMQRFVFSE